MKICKTHGCKNEAKDGNYCYACSKQRYRERHPIKAAYQNLKTNAKRRGKKVLLTFEQFERFCIETDYIKKKGIKKRSFHIDRIDESGDYSIDNIQVLTNLKNVRKYLDYRWNGHKMEFKTRTQKQHQFADVPF